MELNIPRKVILPVTAYQPGCPLQLQYVSLHASSAGGSSDAVIRFRNVSEKTIKGYRIVWVFPGGAGGAWSEKSANVLPGQLVPYKAAPVIEKTASISSQVRGSSVLPNKMQGICLFIVPRVEFLDGSFYEDEEVNNSLQQYFESYLK
jgi:hypothetical protein